MFNKILIANRGEIACRVIRTAKKLGIKTVAVYSEADVNAQHVKQAHEAFCIGPAPSKASYLNSERILEVAKQTGAQAIHPGYGFLSENAHFAKACAAQGFVFIGPPIEAIEAMGSKSAAKTIMQQAGVPLVPGYHGDNQQVEFLQQQAQEIGYPVLLKAALGGGGKGMRAVFNDDQFVDALAAAKREALSSFGDDHILFEKYLQTPRHVEIQLFADQQGHCVYLAERDCSLQRRHQKVIEEAPAPGLPDAIRTAMGEAAVRAAQAIHYVGAGTVEFLYENGQFFFMEMNTRLQVEHPVTEMITGLDLVEWQLLVAAGHTLPLTQAQVTTQGHSIEARIYAEDPAQDFLPATGKIHFLQQPKTQNDVRIDTGVIAGDEVSPFYDPMIAKLIVWGQDRTTALRKLQQALSEYHLAGFTTNISYLSQLAQHPEFAAINLTTHFIDQHQASLQVDTHLSDEILTIASLAWIIHQQQNNTHRWQQYSGWRLNEPAYFNLHWQHQEQQHHIRLSQQGSVFYSPDQQQFTASLVNQQLRLTFNNQQHSATVYYSDTGLTLFYQQRAIELTIVETNYEQQEDEQHLSAPMNGTIISVPVIAGQTVVADQALIIMEAMKMEYVIKAPSAGTVNAVFYQVGDLVSDGAELVDFEPNEES